jgi:hypothetical protein
MNWSEASEGSDVGGDSGRRGDGGSGKEGTEVECILFLCGYFNSGYLGYEAAEG